MSARKTLCNNQVPRLLPIECEDFGDWQLDNICHSGGRSRGQAGRVLQSKHMARYGAAHLRGSDQAERIFIVVMVLVASGWSEKQACVFVADHPKVRLGHSKRGRPGASRSHSRELANKAETVRAIANRFNRPDPINLLRSAVDTFRWQRDNGILIGSLHGDELTLEPHPLSPVPVRMLRHPHEAEVIGQVIGVAMWLGQRVPATRQEERSLGDRVNGCE